jgi:hypothetical protein
MKAGGQIQYYVNIKDNVDAQGQNNPQNCENLKIPVEELH